MCACVCVVSTDRFLPHARVVRAMCLASTLPCSCDRHGPSSTHSGFAISLPPIIKKRWSCACIAVVGETNGTRIWGRKKFNLINRTAFSEKIIFTSIWWARMDKIWRKKGGEVAIRERGWGKVYIFHGKNMPSYWVSVVQLLGLNIKGNQIVSRFKLCHLKQIKLYYYFKHTF